jgi:hypothetical protein
MAALSIKRAIEQTSQYHTKYDSFLFSMIVFCQPTPAPPTKKQSKTKKSTWDEPKQIKIFLLTV